MVTFGIENCKINDVDFYVQNIIEHFNLDKYEADIDITFQKKCDGDAGGYCFGDDESVEIEIATHVQGESLSIKTQLINLAHEMTHAKQLITGQLKDHGLQLATTGDCQSIIKVSEWEGETFTNTAYEDQPWEIEAYAMEREVYDKCFK
jgi:hypothetical protein